jgi:putative endonuclease
VPREKTYWVYILASRPGVLYTGVTNDLARRVWEHKHGTTHSFSSRHRVDCLVYFEQTDDPVAAISREKQIKSWARKKKVALAANPELRDPSKEWD